MKMTKRIMLVMFAALVFGLGACGGGGGSGNDLTTNTDPIANAGVNQDVLTGSTVTLDGSASYDPDGDVLTYLWEFTETPTGSTATLSNTTIVNPIFNANVDGDYVLRLTVDDGAISIMSDPVVITARPFLLVTSLTGRVWADRNLGVSQVATAFDDAGAYGDLYQWGRGTDGHEKRDPLSPITTTLSSSDTPGHGDFITNWSSPWNWRNPQNDNLWQGVDGINNPCPSGFRLPTEAEWDAERLAWSTNNRAGAFASPLRLVSAGRRSNYDGSIYYAGSNGYYWSSSVGGSFARGLVFSSGNASASNFDRASGFSVRCLED